MAEVVIREGDRPQAPGRGLKQRSPEAKTASNLGVETVRYQCVFPTDYLDAIDAACKSVGAERPWVIRAAVRQLVEEGEIVTQFGRARVSDYLP